MNLIIVESPTKARTISKFTGGDFHIASSFGHIRDLHKKELGIDVEHGFVPTYVIPTKARKNVTALKKDAAKSDTIILATDEDREGEAIAWHLTQVLGLGNPDHKAPKSKTKKQQTIQRIVFHEITKSAIEHALANPRSIDYNLVDAQQARRVLDRLVGYKLSPLLWKRYYRGLSAGRVQSVALRLIVERERDIGKFKPEEYWTITALFNTQKGEKLEAQLSHISGKALDKLAIKTEPEAKNIVRDLESATYTVKNVERNEITRSPQAPFITSTMQQEAAKRLHFSSKQTMMFAQQLYEAGYITYMRTDSVNLAEEAITKAHAYISENLGKTYSERRRYKTKSKIAQEAHEAIRPTDPHRTAQNLTGELTPQQAKLYDLIWRRFIASQMAKAVFDATAIDIEALGRSPATGETKSYGFRATGTTMKFDGFLKIYPTKFEESILPIVTAGETLTLETLKPEQHFTKPPARYNEASLIKTLEKEGIGRPSTYASIISTILTRKYVEKDRSRYFHPTEIGMLVNDFLVANFPEIVDIKFTSTMEEELDEIAVGKRQWVPTISEFYEPFAKNLAEKTEAAKKDKAFEAEKTDKTCEKCGSPMAVKMSRFGKFTACSNYPKCKNIIREKKAPPEKTGEKCDKCGTGDMVVRHGRFGTFIACSNYPKCKNTKKIAKENDSAAAETAES